MKDPENIDVPDIHKDFFFKSEGLKLYEVCDQIASYYGINILVYEDIKDKRIHGTIAGLSFQDTLDVVCWLAGVEWVYTKGIYYIGGNKSNICVLDSAGLANNIKDFFKDVKVVGDKLVIIGTERDVKRISGAIKLMLNASYTDAMVFAYEYEYSDSLNIGLDIQKAITYSASWDALLAGQFNPVQAVAVSVAANAKFEENISSSKSILETMICVYSGARSRLQIGEERSIESYTVSNEGTKLVSGLIRQDSGIILDLTGYYSSGLWTFDVRVEKSKAISDKLKTKIETDNRMVIKPGETRCIATLEEEGGTKTIRSGIPFLCDLPIIGYLFGNHTEIRTKKTVFIFMALKPEEKIEREDGQVEPVAVPDGAAAGSTLSVPADNATSHNDPLNMSNPYFSALYSIDALYNRIRHIRIMR